MDNQAVLFEQRMCHLEGVVVEHGIHTCRYTDVHDAHALEASYRTLPMEQRTLLSEESREC